MGITIRKKEGKWFVFVNLNGKRKAKCVGDSRAAAVKVKQVSEAKLAPGELGLFEEAPPQMPTFGDYAAL